MMHGAFLSSPLPTRRSLPPQPPRSLSLNMSQPSSTSTSSPSSIRLDQPNASIWADIHFHARTLISARISDSNSDLITAIWRQRDPVGNKKRSFLTTYTSSSSSSSYVSSLPVELNPPAAVNIHPSPSGQFTLRFMPRSNAPDASTGALIEIWGQHGIQFSFPVTDTVHGAVYTDEWFDSVAWSPDETLVAYIADLPSPSSSSSSSNNDNINSNNNNTKQQTPTSAWASPLHHKFAAHARDPFGEAYIKRTSPALFIADITSGRVTLAAAPECALLGQPQWMRFESSSGIVSRIVCVARPVASRNDSEPPLIPDDLGIRFCYNRPAALVSFDAPESFENVPNMSKSMTYITDRKSSIDFCCSSPRFSPDGRDLVYIAAPRTDGINNKLINNDFILPHNTTKILRYIRIRDNATFSKPISIIDIPKLPRDDCFPGLYLHGLPRRPWLPHDALAFTTSWGSCDRIVVVNFDRRTRHDNDGVDDEHSIVPLDVTSDVNDFLCGIDSVSDSSIVLHDCSNHKLLISVTNTKTPTRLALVDVINPDSPCLQWISHSSRRDEALSSLVASQQIVKLVAIEPRDITSISHVARPFNSKSDDVINMFQVFLVKPTCTARALAVFPHGGPHTSSIVTFSPATAMLLANGFAVLFVNYRGSTGLGHTSLLTLPGHVGTQDVNEVVQATRWALTQFSSSPVPSVFVGGSHSGFIGAHVSLIPNLFLRTVLRNPVVDIAAMAGSTDIPDWCFAEAGVTSDPSRAFVPNPEQLKEMYDRSPIARVAEAAKNGNVIPKTLLQVGGSDRRVPPAQSLEWRRVLTAAFGEGIVRMRWYENSGHAIDEVPEGDDAWVQALDFLCEIFQENKK